MISAPKFSKFLISNILPSPAAARKEWLTPFEGVKSIDILGVAKKTKKKNGPADIHGVLTSFSLDTSLYSHPAAERESGSSESAPQIMEPFLVVVLCVIMFFIVLAVSLNNNQKSKAGSAFAKIGNAGYLLYLRRTCLPLEILPFQGTITRIYEKSKKPSERLGWSRRT